MALKTTVFPIENSPGFIIHKMDTRMAAGLHRAFKRAGYDLTAEQWGVLSKLWEIEGLHQSDLASRLDKDRHNMTRILGVLEKRGLIRRTADAGDRRRQKVFPTQEGRRLRDKLTPVVLDYLKQCLAGLSRREIEAMKQIHEKILKNVEACDI